MRECLIFVIHGGVAYSVRNPILAVVSPAAGVGVYPATKGARASAFHLMTRG